MIAGGRDTRETQSAAGLVACLTIGLVLLGFALSVDIPKAKRGFQGDESTYYSMAHSLARDWDLAFERKDLIRTWEEFPGPEGIFLKRGKAVKLRRGDRFPYFRLARENDPRPDRLYYGKAFIYPLTAAPFVRAFGTNGFLVLHAVLMTLNLLAAYGFLVARRSAPRAALAYSVAFFAASVVPVYFVSLTPELFNLSLVLYAFFLWLFKETIAEGRAGMGTAFLRGPGSDYLAAALLGAATFSKPPHLVLLIPLLGLAAARRQWRRSLIIGTVFALATGGLFLGNAAITGELNYQGGDRKTFYSHTGFPFANERERFENIGISLTTGSVPVEMIATRHTPRVFGHNLVYFIAGRYTGLVPYFFPGVVSFVLFLSAPRRRPGWQWLTGATALLSAITLLLYVPYTYSGGGGSVGNRYYMSFYPLFLFLTPPLKLEAGAITAVVIGCLFTAKMVLSPFDTMFHTADHAKAGPLRLLPVERTLVNDLLVTGRADRARRPLGGMPPVLAYFLDDNAFDPEGQAFWTKGGTRADVILRAPVVTRPDGRALSLRITSFEVQALNGASPNRVTLDSGGDRRVLQLASGQQEIVRLRPDRGVPCQQGANPANWMYTLSVATTSGFVPFLEVPGTSDSRFLGAMITVVPAYSQQE